MQFIRGIPQIETPRLILRALRAADAPQLFAFFCDPETSQYWFTGDETLQQTEQRIEEVNAEWTRDGFGDWAVVEKSSGRFLGFCGLHYISDMAEVNVGYFLHRSAWGSGYGTESARRSIQFGFETAGLDFIVAVAHPDNFRSIRVMEKCGMRYWKNIMRLGLPRVVYAIDRPLHRD